MLNLAVLATVTRLHDGRDRQCVSHLCPFSWTNAHFWLQLQQNTHTLCPIPL